VGNLTGDSSKGGDIEKGSSGGGGKLSKQSIAAENLKVFTQVRLYCDIAISCSYLI
jgi:hypothetical protein